MNLLFIPEIDIFKEQKHASGLLEIFLESGQIPHALLFTGIDGSGKRDTAIAFAMACNCERTPSDGKRIIPESVLGSVPCGRCRSCRKIVSGSHPDISVLEPSGMVIKIKEIRRLCDRLSLKPYEAELRLAVIIDAHRMTKEAGNALLKVLEEPPPQTLLILTATERADLLPTLVSRCQHIRFRPLSDRFIAGVLTNRRGLAEDEAAALAQMAQGSLSRALAMAESAEGAGSWMDRRRSIIAAAGLDRPESIMHDPLTLSMAFAQRFSADKALLPEALKILQSYLRDLVTLQWKPSYLFNKDLTSKMQYVSQHVSLATLLAQIEAIQRTQNDLESNVNIRLALETLMIDFRKAYHEKDRRNPV